MLHQVSETIPYALSERVDAAVAFFNDSDLAAGDTFSATGIIDADNALDQSGDLKLILCGGDRCEQHSFRVSGTGTPWSIEFVVSQPAEENKPQAELDPPPGARLPWLDATIAQHSFVVLLFYRGFW
ncbi:hypothetical protein E0F26_05315 [Candidatus Paraluminiphilus aquimaris]|uniref:Uncharacterized protein n=1 Tax=Candidatus Paraluminiphilus aquimaris TaxID=2518994 RepID=A0ABY6Q6N2_9GAMM|nr:hypothetical protein [Candidatus Paraluminiphilus aquimaris]UZP74195.1 hypothetical protein E0F26_05315 [Candidatus Paraluminiphilus aquimaris]